MAKIIPKLDDLLKTIEGFETGVTGFLAVNVDDVFKILKGRGVNEVKVSWEEMITIALFVVSNIQNGKNTQWDALQILREGKVDKFLGVKLILV